jgi:Ala-tRNA(Pro) deacylase
MSAAGGAPDAASSVPDEPAPVTPEELLARLQALGIEAHTVSHRPVFTVEEAKAYRGDLEGAHVKNLFLRDKKGAMWLVVAVESRPIDLKALAAKLGHKGFSFASEQRLRRYLGVIPGAVTPFGVVNDRDGKVSVALDAALREHELWNFHPLVNSMTTTIRAADMARFLESVDHPPRWVSFD